MTRTSQFYREAYRAHLSLPPLWPSWLVWVLVVVATVLVVIS